MRLGGSVPNEFICDMSPALISAAVQAYGGKSSLPDYLNSLFNILNGGNDAMPKCFVRIDIAHFVKDVAKCKHLKAVRLKHRDFFIRSVVLLIKMKSLSEIRNHIYAIMVVAMSQTEGKHSNIHHPAEMSRKSFKTNLESKHTCELAFFTKLSPN